MRLSLKDTTYGQYRPVEFKKSKDETRVEIIDENTGEHIVTLVTGRGGSYVIEANHTSPRVKLAGLEGKAIDYFAVQAAKDHPDDEMAKHRNWKIDETEDGRVLAIWHPESSKAISLPIMPLPGSHTPVEPVHEIYGQKALLFNIALGIKLGKNTLLAGPTGTGKSTIYEWLAQKLNWNYVKLPISRGTEAYHMIGEYVPVGKSDFRWIDGPMTVAARLSIEHPTILCMEEINRIGNIAEFSRCYSLLDDSRMLELNEKRGAGDEVEVINVGQLHVCATLNPADDIRADYIGVQELDPAFTSRFPFQPSISYPPADVETSALQKRVDTLTSEKSDLMVKAANKVRQATNVRFPMSFRELEAWALLEPYLGFKEAAEVAVISKASSDYHAPIRSLLGLI